MLVPRGVLVCRPTFFDVVDVKNPFMNARNPVDRGLALRQWQTLRDAFEASGLEIREIEPLPGAEDMVFTANPAFTGLDRAGNRRAVESRMHYASRQSEVAAQIGALRDMGYDIAQLPPGIQFEGGGDAVWHLGGNVIFLGIGPRSDSGAIAVLEKTFEVEVVPLRLKTERFYHLDTAFAMLDDATALVYPDAFDAASYCELSRRCARLIEVGEVEAGRMACNASRAGNNVVIIDSSASGTISELRTRGYDVATVDTSEFVKSGGSVYCMKQYVF